ncbi:MAG: hypothetical protein EAZ89_12860 [Bacteroidetes bacterium]|nr:MAG: hypothetical protein EAZ89_12860 [Bacteroidota bacterium]
MQLLRNTLLLFTLLLSGICAFAQMGQVWPTQTRQRFDIDENGETLQEYEVEDYPSYFLFINDKEFIHCTGDITSLYKITSAKEQDSYMSYEVLSEVGNEYVFNFDPVESQVVIVSATGFALFIQCLPMYETAVFETIGKRAKP